MAPLWPKGQRHRSQAVPNMLAILVGLVVRNAVSADGGAFGGSSSFTGTCPCLFTLLFDYDVHWRALT